MVRPYYTLLLLLLVIALLGAFVWFFPSGELAFNDSVKLRFVSLDEVMNPKEVKYADITNILSHEETLNTESALHNSKLIDGKNSISGADSAFQASDSTISYSKADIV